MTNKNTPEGASDELVNIAVGIAIEPGRTGKVLVARRRREALRGGLWEFPGGKIESGETAEDAVRREFLEELGCEIEILARLPVSDHHDPSVARESHVRLEPFAGRLATTARPRPITAEELRWVPIDDLHALAWPPANLAIIETLQAWWRSRDEHRRAE